MCPSNEGVERVFLVPQNSTQLELSVEQATVIRLEKVPRSDRGLRSHDRDRLSALR